MKVNIIGKGVIPGINQLAPAYNQELEKHQVHRLLNYSNLKVYGSDGIGLITKKNIDAVFNTKIKNKKPAVANKAAVKSEPPQEPKFAMRAVVPESVADALAEAKDPIKPEVGSPKEIDHIKPVSFDLARSEGDNNTEEPLPEITDEVVTEEAVYEPVTEVEEPTEEVVGDTISDDETDETTKTEEIKPHYNNRNKKKNKNRHNNNN